jgi:peptidyl-prolyl cis-trans isomerase D
MLQFIRSHAGSFYVKLLFVLLIGSFGIWGVGDIIRQAPLAAAPISVGHESFSTDQVRHEFQRNLEQYRQMLGPGLDAQKARALGLVDRTVDGIVQNALLDQEAQRLRIAVGDQQVATAIAQIPALRRPDGGIDKAVLIQNLRRLGESEEQFIAGMRDDLRRGSLASVAGQTPIAPHELVETLYDIRNEHRVADFVFLPTAAVTGLPSADDAALHSFYDQHHDSYTAPEYRAFTLLTLQLSDVAGGVQIDEDKIKATYQERVGDAEHPGEYVKPETRHVLQMLLPDQATADQAEAAIATGTDFAEIAKTIAKQDPTTIDLGSVAKNDLPAELAGTVFDAQAGDVTKPLQSALGFTVLKVLDIKPGEIKTYDEAKAQIESELKADAERDALDKLESDVDNALSGGAELAAIADQYKLKPIAVTAVDDTGKDPAGTAMTALPIPTDTVLKTVFDTAQGSTSSLEEVDKTATSFYAIKVDSVTAPALKPFDSVKDQVLADWTAEQRVIKVAAEAKDLAAAVRPDMTLAQLAAARGLKLEATKSFTRLNEKGDTTLPQEAIAALFKDELGGVATGTAPDGQFVAQLKEIQPAKPDADAVGTDRLKQQLDRQLGQELVDEFQLALRDRYAVEVNHTEIDQLLGGGPSQ